MHTEVSFEPTQRTAQEQPLGPGGSVPRRECEERLVHLTGSVWARALPTPRRTGLCPCREEPPSPEAQRPSLRSLNGAYAQPPQEAAHLHFRKLCAMGVVVCQLPRPLSKRIGPGRGGRTACWEFGAYPPQPRSPRGIQDPLEKQSTRARAPFRSAAPGVWGDIRPTLYKKAALELPFAFAGAAECLDGTKASP